MKKKAVVFKSDDDFRLWAVQKVKDNIRNNNYPCSINRVSEVAVGRCEWCNNTTRVVYISVQRNPNAPEFTKGHCNSGQYSIHEDERFRSQSEWFVCGQCKDS